MRRSFTVVAALLVSLVLTAATVTKEEARQKAIQFLEERGSGVAAARGMQPVNMMLKEGAVTDELYVFNVGQQEGFVIVSGDDCTGDAVLAYADKGEISSDRMPDNLKAWLQGYADQIKWMQDNGVRNDVAASRAVMKSQARKSVAPCLTTLWNQDEPYNNNCPKLNAEGTVTAATGCVATAVAQVMYYQATENSISSTTTVTIPSYKKTKTNSWYINGVSVTEMPEKAPVTIDWTKIDPALTTDAAKSEVARLMEYVGAGLQMQYGTTSSANSRDIPNVLRTYFGYDANAQMVIRNNYTYGEWLDLIYNELTENGPVLYGGHSTAGGHEFVLDGYSEEDYFYVNWGWGGSSNGYFKLSVLYSEQQGIGGSTSQIGYSIDQDAIVGVNPNASIVNSAIRFTVEKAWPEKTTYVRTSTSEDFTNVKLHSKMFNFTSATRDISFGFGLYKGNDFIKLLWENYGTFTNSVGYNDSWGSCSFGAGLEDGVYDCVPVSCLKSSDTWYPDFGSNLHYVRAIISGTTLTLVQMDKVSLTAGLTTSGNIAGKPVTVTATVTNNGMLYSGNLVLSWGEKEVSAQQIELAAGKTKDIVFTFTPSATGSQNLILKDKENTELGKILLEVIASDATTGTLSIQHSDITFSNQVGENYYNGFYGSKLQGQVTLTNESTENDHTSGLTVGLYIHDNGNRYAPLAFKNCATNVAKNGGTEVVNFEFDDLTKGVSYLMVFSSVSQSAIMQTYTFNNVYGIDAYLADGTTQTVAPASSITVGSDVLAIDCSHISGVTSVTPGSNPNTLYVLGDNNPTGLDGKNVVKNGTPITLTLTDGYGFYSPVEFTAQTATYTRRFTTGADGTKGWSTIVLPFDVTTVKQGETTIDWFHSSTDKGKNFWLKEYIGEDGSSVTFDYADELNANTPYIIAVPGSKWGANWNLTNKDITFSASDVVIPATPSTSLSANNYKFTGTYRAKAVTDNYVLNSDGNAFKKASATVDAFRAYFVPLTMQAGYTDVLTIGPENGETTGVTAPAVVEQTAGGKVYNLNGQRVIQPKKGLYIIDGKKVVIK